MYTQNSQNHPIIRGGGVISRPQFAIFKTQTYALRYWHKPLHHLPQPKRLIVVHLLNTHYGLPLSQIAPLLHISIATAKRDSSAAQLFSQRNLNFNLQVSNLNSFISFHAKLLQLW